MINVSSIRELTASGQSIWYDYVEREFVNDGELTAIVNQGVSGLTSNPTIFEQAICNSKAYDRDIQSLLSENLSAQQVYDRLSTDDIRNVAKILLSVYERTNGKDGYVSIEVSPHVSNDAEVTVAEGIRLSKVISSPNLMIKVPATPEGYEAITKLLAHGISVNVTLIFGMSQYRQVVEAYLNGVEQAIDKGIDVTKIASVASFFVSRVDTLVDNWLDENNAGSELKGKIGIANSMMAYRYFQEQFNSERFQSLAQKGVQVQRLLWASTSTKNPNYDSLLYVKELALPETVNTVAPKTFKEMLHTEFNLTEPQDIAVYEGLIRALEQVGLSIDFVAEELLRQGLVGFTQSYDRLLKEVDNKLALLSGEK
ncbi:transaldolase [Alicyclobacillus dauci]|uniref:Transaldolase n=1 Tax=Alicyclobacillus dauci TaxID=1475485 RepID=A0ABY6Z7J7_9BACL|nr:transaldolase [Alicyclobacillus dauci]WAH38865.1 transaldolase [Alicyclobacillus dauci]